MTILNSTNLVRTLNQTTAPWGARSVSMVLIWLLTGGALGVTANRSLAATVRMKTTSVNLRAPSPPPVRTSFDPAKRDFAFGNSFKNDFVPGLNWTTSGLCGGMSYSVLDYYFSSVPVPLQPFPPANGTTLYNYLYDRQVNSIVSNVDRWAELKFNPGGARNTEFFHWGLNRSDRLMELQSFIDNGKPAVLGMYGIDGTGDHQVVAIGYEMGRYKGDLGVHMDEFKIFIADPNYPGETRTLVPDVQGEFFHYVEGGGKKWRTYFVDKNYHVKRPPRIDNGNFPDDGLVHEIILDFATGGDDLRGLNDNINLTVNLMDATQEVHKNINQGARWINNSHNFAEVVLNRPVPFNKITSLIISDTFTGGSNGDNWNMDSLHVHTWGHGFYNQVKAIEERTRFTGENKVLDVPINNVVADPGEIKRLWFTIKTGDDDLRGVNDNLNLTIHFRDGKTQQDNNANEGQRWPDNTSHEFHVDLNRAVKPDDITSIDLRTTFTGGSGGDNWNMDSISVRAQGNQVDRVIASHGYQRFTGDDTFLSIPVTLAAAGRANKLELTFKTDDDDLRGGNDNLNVTVHFRGGRTQVVRNINGSQNWANGSTHVPTFVLDQAVDPEDIVAIDLRTTSGGGVGGDNWSMKSVSIKVTGGGVDQEIFKHGSNRFTGDKPSLRLTK